MREQFYQSLKRKFKQQSQKMRSQYSVHNQLKPRNSFRQSNNPRSQSIKKRQKKQQCIIVNTKQSIEQIKQTYLHINLPEAQEHHDMDVSNLIQNYKFNFVWFGKVVEKNKPHSYQNIIYHKLSQIQMHSNTCLLVNLKILKNQNLATSQLIDYYLEPLLNKLSKDKWQIYMQKNTDKIDFMSLQLNSKQSSKPSTNVISNSKIFHKVLQFCKTKQRKLQIQHPIIVKVFKMNNNCIVFTIYSNNCVSHKQISKIDETVIGQMKANNINVIKRLNIVSINTICDAEKFVLKCNVPEIKLTLRKNQGTQLYLKQIIKKLRNQLVLTSQELQFYKKKVDEQLDKQNTELEIPSESTNIKNILVNTFLFDSLRF